MFPDDPNAADARLALVERFFRGTGESYDAMVNCATLGIDRLWKKAIVARIPAGEGPVLDLACGTGISTLAIARRFPARRVIGVELRDEYLAIARRKVARDPAPNVTLVLSRAEDYESDLAFDCVSSSYLAKYAELARLTALTRRLLRPGGTLIMHDFTLPPQPLRALWSLYFVVMRATVARAMPSWSEIYRGLPLLIERTRWVEELTRELTRNAFTDVRVEPLALYGSTVVTARRA